MTAQTFDWRTLAPDQERHYCDCEYCPMEGELEPIQWPVLVRMLFADDEYVSDRFIAVRADLAPVPDGYEGTVLGPTDAASLFPTEVTDEPATGMQFRWNILKVVESCDWRLRLLLHPADAGERRRRTVGVTAADGALIGWAIAAANPSDDARSDRFTREYQEPA